MRVTGVDKTQARDYMVRYEGNLQEICEEITLQQEFLETKAACEWQGKKCEMCGKNTKKNTELNAESVIRYYVKSVHM